MKYIINTLIATALASTPLTGQTIAEKRATLANKVVGLNAVTQAQLDEVNLLLWEKRQHLRLLLESAHTLYEEEVQEASFAPLRDQIKQLKHEILSIEAMWREESASLIDNEGYALWHQADSTVFQAVMDFGAPDHVYIIPPEIGKISLSFGSQLPIPREAWEECLKLLLTQMGIGIQELNPYLRQLYLFTNDQAKLECITENTERLEILPASCRVCFLLTPNSPDPMSAFRFLEKFSNEQTTAIHLIGGKVFIIASAEEVRELLKLYSFASEGGAMHDYQLVSVSKMDVEEMASILRQTFGEETDGTSLQIMPLSESNGSLFLSGTKDRVRQARKMIEELEQTIADPKEKTVFWYTTKHSDAHELAEVLGQVYDLLINGSSLECAQEFAEKALTKPLLSEEDADKNKNGLAIDPISISPEKSSKKRARSQPEHSNFVVDPKTGAIIMVVEQEALPQIQKLLQRLDVPKKMVQLEVLLFEKKISSQANFGLNLLKLGSNLLNSNLSLAWNPAGTAANGILEFLISHKKGKSGIPSYDLTYNFLLGQDDVQITASPSVTTINQTPATISLVDEISINTGVEESKKGTPKDVFTRKQFGIVINITPTINQGGLSEDDTTEFVTLETDITFDSNREQNSDKPTVTRRHIKNHVRVADGETLILGGLRTKSQQDGKESIPFLGEIPGIGKLFSTTKMNDSTTEMFIFITPKIISDPIKDAQRVQKELLKKRPGDLPEFLVELDQARDKEKKRLFSESLKALFGREETTVAKAAIDEREYDGRN